MVRTQEEAIEVINHLLRYAATKVKHLREELAREDRHPADVLAWAEDEFVAAARLQVLKLALTLVEEAFPEDAVHALITQAEEEVQRGARWPKNSSSTIMNFMHRATTSAWAELLADLEGL